MGREKEAKKLRDTVYSWWGSFPEMSACNVPRYCKLCPYYEPFFVVVTFLLLLILSGFLPGIKWLELCCKIMHWLRSEQSSGFLMNIQAATTVRCFSCSFFCSFYYSEPSQQHVFQFIPFRLVYQIIFYRFLPKTNKQKCSANLHKTQ